MVKSKKKRYVEKWNTNEYDTHSHIYCERNIVVGLKGRLYGYIWYEDQNFVR